MAGASIAVESERASIVRPLKTTPLTNLHAMDGESDAAKAKSDESEAKEHGVDEDGEADKWKEHVEDLTRRVAQHFEDEHGRNAVSPPLVKSRHHSNRRGKNGNNIRLPIRHTDRGVRLCGRAISEAQPS